MPTYPIRALTVGEVLDTAVAITKNHFWLLFGVMLRSLVLFRLVERWSLLELDAEFGNDSTIYWVAYYSSAVFELLVVWPLASGAATYGISRLYLSEPVSAGMCYRQALRRWWAFVRVSTVSTFYVCVGLLLIIPGIVLGFRYFLVNEIVILENYGTHAALRRSTALMRGSYSEAVGLLVIMAVLFFAAEFALGLIGEPFLQGTAACVLSGVLAVFAAACYTVFYFSCRCRSEHFDLEVLAGAVEADSPPADEAALEEPNRE